MDKFDEGDILPNPDEVIEYENKMGYSEGEEIDVTYPYYIRFKV